LQDRVPVRAVRPQARIRALVLSRSGVLTFLRSLGRSTLNGRLRGTRLGAAAALGASAVMFVASGSAVASSSGAGARGDSGTLVVGVAGDYSAFDPCLGGTPQTTEVVASTYGYPVGFKTRMANGVPTQVADDTNAWVPQLAKSIDISHDYRTYTFHLRPGVKFTQTENPMTADDWMWTFKRDLAKPAIGFCSSDLANAAITSISQVKEINKMTIQIKVPAATNHLTLAYLRSVDFGIIDSVAAKKHATKSDPWASHWLATHSAGTGPYYVQSVSPGNEVVLARDPDYWGGAGGFSKIVLKVVPDLATRMALMQSGELDMAEGIPPRQAQALKHHAGIKVLDLAQGNRIAIVMNSKVAPFNNVLVRKALAYALPVKDIIKTVYDGYARPYKSFVLAGIPGYSGAGYKPRYDLAEAKALLAKAGVAHGLKLTLTIDAANPDWQGIATLYQESLARIGVQLNVDTLQDAAFTGKEYAYDLTFAVTGQVPWIDDPGTIADAYMVTNGYANLSHFSNSTIDAIYAKWATKPDSKARESAFVKAQNIFNANVPAAYVALNDFTVVLKSDIHGYKLYKDTNTHFQDLYRG
jgi:peptide/nickel transport system substrate-binding protein